MKGGGEGRCEVEKDEGRWKGKEGSGEGIRKKEAGKRRVVGVTLQAFSVSRSGVYWKIKFYYLEITLK